VQQQASHAQLSPPHQQLQPQSLLWQQQQQQQWALTSAGCASSAPCGSYTGSMPEGSMQLGAAVQEVDSGTDADEDEWCVQLLQDVEQQAALRHKVTAG
jgi:hypothetical protein